MSRPAAPDPGLLDAFLARTALDRHLLSREVYGGATLAVEFHYRDVRFAFDVTPLADGRTELVLVDRAHETGFAMLEDAPDGRETLGTHDEDWVVQEHLHNRAVRMMSQIDARLDRAAPAAPAPTAAGQGGLTVGIMTLPLNANYGGNLQTFALMQVLRAMGHAPLLINVRHPWGKDADVDPSRPPIAESIDLDPEIANGAFIDRYLQPMTRSFTKPGDLAAQVGALGLGAVVAGSDQIWRARYARTLLLPFYYCGFLSEGSPVRRVSYAASFGQPDWQYDEGQTRRAAQLIRRFDGASVCEDNAVELCRDNLGVEPAHVLDPTLLLDPEAYDPVLAEAPVARPPGGLLTDILDVTPDKAEAIATLSEALSKPATRPDGAGFGAEGAGPDPSVEGWLAAFRAADFIVTDSFHGVAFAILFGKPFLACGDPGRGMARFASMLRTVGLEDRLIRDSSEIDVDRMRQPIDWNAVGERLGGMRQRSLDFLKGALTGDPQVRPAPVDRASASAPAGPAPRLPSPTSAASEGAPFRIPAAEARVEIEDPLGTLRTGCGSCMPETRGALRMEWNRDGFSVPRATMRDEDVPGAAFLPDMSRSHPEGGRLERIHAGYGLAHRAAGASGGTATWVFERLFARGDADHLFAVRDDGDGEALVQIPRQRTRARGLKVWRETWDVAAFRRRMRQRLRRLGHITPARTRGAVDPLRCRQAVRGFVAGEDGWAWLRRHPMGRWLRGPAFGVDEMRALDATCSREQTR